MLWIALGVVLFLILFAYQRWKAMAPLFADEHLREVALALPELKRQALATPATNGAAPAEPPSIQTAHLALAYSISQQDGRWVHHVSASNRLTPARAAGTFFLGLARGLLRLDAYPFDAFVSRTHVFHLEVRLSDEEEQAFADLPVETKGAGELRTIATQGRSAILPRLGLATVPAATLPPDGT
jgi:hypothetical protein